MISQEEAGEEDYLVSRTNALSLEHDEILQGVFLFRAIECFINIYILIATENDWQLPQHVPDAGPITMTLVQT